MTTSVIECSWKKNWPETKQKFKDWWHREGLVIGMWGGINTATPHEKVEFPSSLPPVGSDVFYTNVDQRVHRNHYALANQNFPADIIPIAHTMIGPGSLALYLGSEPEFREESVWFNTTLSDLSKPEEGPRICFNPENKWWKIHEETLIKSAALGKGKYLTGCPDLVENIDILASLRGTTNLFIDMVERPEWVIDSIDAINEAYFDIYDRIYSIIKQEDGGSAYEAYMIWGPGKTAKVQCDASAMFSPAMFRKFVQPALSRQCQWLDYSLYHLDGKEEWGHLDALLEIEALDAIEWTPNAGEPLGGDPKWFDLYKRILDAGKSIQVYLVFADEIVPLLDEIGGKGVHVLGLFKDETEVELILKNTEQFCK